MNDPFCKYTINLIFFATLWQFINASILFGISWPDLTVLLQTNQSLFIVRLLLIMLRSQIQMQKQSFTHKNIDLKTQPTAQRTENIPSYSDHKSICYIQLTDYSDNGPREDNASFRTTFFSKIGKRISPKKSFFKTMMGKFQLAAAQDKIKLRKSERSEDKGSSIAKEYSERSNFIIKKLNEGIKNNDRSNASTLLLTEQASSNKTEDNQMSLIEDIQRLRYSENGYLQMLKDKSLLSTTNIINLEIERQESYNNLITRQSYEQTLGDNNRLAKEEAALRLKQKVKNKQSRRHIYHSLKSKCDAWNKIRLKTQQNFSHKEGTSASTVEMVQSTRLHCKQISQNARNIQAIIIKPKPQPIADTSNPLKIISKPCMISLNSFTNSSLTQSPTKQMNISLSGSPESPLNKLKAKKDVFQEIITSIGRSRKDNNFGRCRTGEKAEQRNQFRLLTPWRADNQDVF